MILGAFFYGFFFTQVPTGYLCMKYGGKNVLMFSMGSASFIHILIPFIVRFNDSLFFAARVLQGLLLVSDVIIINTYGGDRTLLYKEAL